MAAQEYLAGYLIEESLSIDNLFVFLLVFGSLGIALRYQRKVLFWGILGAISCAACSSRRRGRARALRWVMYLFGACSWSRPSGCCARDGVQMIRSAILWCAWRKRFFPVASTTGNAFTVRRAGRRMLTPLAIAWSPSSRRLVFAVDSVPAVLALLGVSIWYPAIVIGVVAFIFTAVGLHLGRRFGALLGRRMEIIGGLILIGIGVNILIEHLF